jgi:osmoprotectant transport system permease protein
MTQTILALLFSTQVAVAPAPVRVGSKQFTESVLLAEIAAQLLAEDGVPALHRRQLGGTRVLWEALLAGEIEAYPEYTGTLREELLPEARRADLAALAAALEKRGLRMTQPLGFENTYALGMKEGAGVANISALAARPELRFGFSNEFMDRADGWPALQRAYQLPQQSVRGLDHDLAYRALASGEIDVTDLYSTDAEIRQYGLKVLADDRHHFPEYQAVFLYRAGLDARAVASLRKLEGKISEAQMIDLNARSKVERVAEPLIAQDFLSRRLGVDSDARVDGRAGRIAQRTAEHLFLVFVSLLAAVAVAIPLGVLAARRPRVGQGVLAAAGILQTIPSLALLVLMIPLLGIGACCRSSGTPTPG